MPRPGLRMPLRRRPRRRRWPQHATLGPMPIGDVWCKPVSHCAIFSGSLTRSGTTCRSSLRQFALLSVCTLEVFDVVEAFVVVVRDLCESDGGRREHLTCSPGRGRAPCPLEPQPPARYNVAHLLRQPFIDAKSTFSSLLSLSSLGDPVISASPERCACEGLLLRPPFPAPIIDFLYLVQAEPPRSPVHVISSSTFHFPRLSLSQHVSSCLGSSKWPWAPRRLCAMPEF